MFSRTSQGEWRASPGLYKVLLTAHIIVSVGWLGAVLAKLVLGFIALTASVPEAARSLYGAMELLNIVFPPWPSAQLLRASCCLWARDGGWSSTTGS